MIITYTQADDTRERVSTNDLSAIESADIEAVMGGTAWRVVEDQLRSQDPTAMRAVLWAFRKRTDPSLKFSDVDVPGWRRRLKARIEREEIDDVLENLMAEALAASEDSTIEAMLPHLRKLAEDRDDIEAALNALGKGHLVTAPADSED
ncbi:hypothetical protein ABZ771_00420 [Streptomyces globisporus]|uniref:hypothetical protein n=1 Tax=Streptomyces globisporus TaxID=1908 RepID=UPI003460199B